jgi:putative SOS response-associated peptidase YedK
MRWGLVPSWWEKSLKVLKLATFSARAESVAEKPSFRGAFRQTRRLLPVSGYAWLSAKAGLELLKPATNDLLQRWPVSRRGEQLARARPTTTRH